jgi:hypothetical protein
VRYSEKGYWGAMAIRSACEADIGSVIRESDISLSMGLIRYFARYRAVEGDAGVTKKDEVDGAYVCIQKERKC